MIEFDVSLSKKYVDREAVAQKMKTRLAVKSGEIPYTQYGLNYNLFTYLDPTSAIQTALGANVGVTVEGNRVAYAGVEINVEDIENGVL